MAPGLRPGRAWKGQAWCSQGLEPSCGTLLPGSPHPYALGSTARWLALVKKHLSQPPAPDIPCPQSPSSHSLPSTCLLRPALPTDAESGKRAGSLAHPGAGRKMPFGRALPPALLPNPWRASWGGRAVVGPRKPRKGEHGTGLVWNGFPEEAGFKLGQLGEASSEAARTHAQPWPRARAPSTPSTPPPMRQTAPDKVLPCQALGRAFRGLGAPLPLPHLFNTFWENSFHAAVIYVNSGQNQRCWQPAGGTCLH